MEGEQHGSASNCSVPSSSKKLSGAASRKRRQEKEKLEKAFMDKVPRLTKFFTAPQQEQTVEVRDAIPAEEVQSEETKGLGTSTVSEDDETFEGTPSPEEAQNQGISSTVIVSTSATSDYFDIANFVKPLSNESIQMAIKKGPYQQSGPFPKDVSGRNKGRGFDASYFIRIPQNKTTTALKIKRQWLGYSPNLKACYCLPCWLFDAGKDRFGSSSGYNDWAHITRAIESHENSTEHSRACGAFDCIRTQRGIDDQLATNMKENVRYWRLVLRRLLDVTLLLGMNDLPFREHRKTADGSTSMGNFLEVIHLLARYDDILAVLIKRPAGTVNYLSPEIQNELINLLADELVTQIMDEIRQAPFVSIILDSTQDIAKVDQLSCIFRYVHIQLDENDKPIALDIKESFVGFTPITSQSAEELEKVALGLINKFTSVDRLRGQGYDGAANMSGSYSGLQTRIKQHNPSARYIHCVAHRLNLVINDAVAGIADIRCFYDRLEGVYVFFSAITRWSQLQDGPMKTTIKRVCPTRWSSRCQALDALRVRYPDVMRLLTHLSVFGKNADERSSATSFLHYFEEFSTVILVVVQSHILGSVDIISQLLQSKEEDMEKASEMLTSLITKLTVLRESWSDVKDEAIALATAWGISTQFKEKRVSRIKRMDDELICDQRISDPEQRFRVEVFIRNVDVVLAQLKARLGAISEVTEIFQCLTPKILTDNSLSDNELIKLADKLVEAYDLDISPNLGAQLIRFRTCFTAELQTKALIRDVTEMLLCHSNAASSFTDIITGGLLFLTLPVTVASAERSFSKLKLIKQYLRSTMSQLRLSSLAMLSIERLRAKTLDLDPLITRFATTKARCVDI